MKWAAHKKNFSSVSYVEKKPMSIKKRFLKTIFGRIPETRFLGTEPFIVTYVAR
jgi:hypothetical protein